MKIRKVDNPYLHVAGKPNTILNAKMFDLKGGTPAQIADITVEREKRRKKTDCSH